MNSPGSDFPEVLRGLVPPVGSIWHWEPLLPHASCRVRVVGVRWNGEAVWVETVPVVDPGWEEVAVLPRDRYWVTEEPDGWHVRVYDEQAAGVDVVPPAHSWNDLGRWMEAAVLVEPAP